MKRIILIIILISTYHVYAQVELSVAQCREMALQSSYDMQIASLQYDKTVADQKAVLSSFFPKISATGTYAYIFEDIGIGMDIDIDLLNLSIPFEMLMSMKGAYMAGITLQQPVFVGGKIITGNKMAKKGIEMTEENKRLTRMSVIVEAEKAYWIYVSVREKVKLLESYMALLDSLHGRVSDFSEMQMAKPSDIQKIKAKQSNIKYELQRAQSGLELSRMSLCHIIGVDLTTPIVVTDTIIELSQNDSYHSSNIAQRPEYQILQKQMELSKLSIKNIRADFLPRIGFSAGYSYVGGIKARMNVLDYDLGETNMNMSLPMVMANISIPICQFGEGAKKIKSAKLAYAISELELKKNSELMNIEVQQTLSEYKNSFLLIETAQEAILEAETGLKIAKDNYELRMGTIFDVLEAQTQWQEAHSNLIEARTNCKIKEVEYLKSTGTLK